MNEIRIQLFQSLKEFLQSSSDTLSHQITGLAINLQNGCILTDEEILLLKSSLDRYKSTKDQLMAILPEPVAHLTDLEKLYESMFKFYEAETRVLERFDGYCSDDPQINQDLQDFKHSIKEQFHSNDEEIKKQAISIIVELEKIYSVPVLELFKNIYSDKYQSCLDMKILLWIVQEKIYNRIPPVSSEDLDFFQDSLKPIHPDSSVRLAPSSLDADEPEIMITSPNFPPISHSESVFDPSAPGSDTSQLSEPDDLIQNPANAVRSGAEETDSTVDAAPNWDQSETSVPSTKVQPAESEAVNLADNLSNQDKGEEASCDASQDQILDEEVIYPGVIWEKKPTKYSVRKFKSEILRLQSKSPNSRFHVTPELTFLYDVASTGTMVSKNGNILRIKEDKESHSSIEGKEEAILNKLVRKGYMVKAKIIDTCTVYVLSNNSGNYLKSPDIYRFLKEKLDFSGKIICLDGISDEQLLTNLCYKPILGMLVRENRPNYAIIVTLDICAGYCKEYPDYPSFIALTAPTEEHFKKLSKKEPAFAKCMESSLVVVYGIPQKDAERKARWISSCTEGDVWYTDLYSDTFVRCSDGKTMGKGEFSEMLKEQYPNLSETAIPDTDSSESTGDSFDDTEKNIHPAQMDADSPFEHPAIAVESIEETTETDNLNGSDEEIRFSDSEPTNPDRLPPESLRTAEGEDFDLGLSTNNNMSSDELIEQVAPGEDQADQNLAEPLPDEDNMLSPADSSLRTDHPSQEPLEDPMSISSAMVRPPEGWVESITKLLQNNSSAYAMAYMNVLAHQYPSVEFLQKRLSLAFNDPVNDNDYSSKNVIATFESDTQELPGYEEMYVAAALHSLFDDRAIPDYETGSLLHVVQSLSLTKDNPHLGNIVKILHEFRIETQYCAPDQFADYRNLLASEKRKRADRLRANLAKKEKELFSSSNRFIIQHPVYKKVHTQIFSKQGDFYAALQTLISDNPDLDFAQAFLLDSCIKAGDAFRSSSISEEKMNEWIETIWINISKHERGRKNPKKDKNTGRNTLRSKLRPVFEDMADLIDNSTKENSEAIERFTKNYQRILPELTKEIEAAFEMIESSENPYIWIVSNSLQEISKKISGCWTLPGNTFYSPFLHGGLVYLDDSNYPILESVPTIEELSIENRILKASEMVGQDFQKRVEKMESEPEHDLGMIAKIFDYLEDLEQPVSEQYRINIEKNLEQKRRLSSVWVQGFLEDLELNQSYGRFDDSNPGRKDEIIRIILDLHGKAKDTGNYSLLNAAIECFKKEMDESAERMSARVQNQLDEFMKEHDPQNDADLALRLEKVQKRIDARNLTAAEDLLNRIGNGDSADSDRELNLWLEDFLDNYNVLCSRYNGRSLFRRTIKVPGRLNMRYRTDAQNLIDSWPTNNMPSPDSLERLLKSLGLQSFAVSREVSRNNWSLYYAVPRHLQGESTAARYPLAKFGSQLWNSDAPLRILVTQGTLTADNLLEILRGHKSQSTTIIFADPMMDLPNRKKLARKLKEDLFDQSVLYLDRATVSWLIENYEGLNSTADKMISISAPFSYQQPYDLSASGDTPTEMFIGRTSELSQIVDPRGVNLVYGGRQLGKTALLRRAEKQISSEGKSQAIYIDIKDYDTSKAAKRIGFELFEKGILDKDLRTDDWDELYIEIRTAMKNQPDISYLLLLLDEADTFIDKSRELNYQPLTVLRNLQQDLSGRFKFVLAGLRNVARFKAETLHDNSPFGQLNSITIRPFQYTDARELLERPLHYLGFRFPAGEEGDMLVSNILGQTNYFPGLIQLYCAKLIESLHRNYGGFNEANTPPYLVSEDQIKKVLTDENLLFAIREKFSITLHVGSDDYYMILACLIAYLMQDREDLLNVSLEEILNEAQEWEITKITDLHPDSVRQLLEEMSDLNVLQKSNAGRWRFSRINFLSMLGTAEDLAEKLMEYSS